jgi:hypothetical protein
MEMSQHLPPWLPEWEGAAELAAQTDIARLRADVADLVGYVLAEDTTVLDSLPEEVESALVTPLTMLGRVHDDGTDPVELVAAARLVRRSVAGCLDRCPDPVRARLLKLPS